MIVPKIISYYSQNPEFLRQQNSPKKNGLGTESSPYKIQSSKGSIQFKNKSSNCKDLTVDKDKNKNTIFNNIEINSKYGVRVNEDIIIEPWYSKSSSHKEIGSLKDNVTVMTVDKGQARKATTNNIHFSILPSSSLSSSLLNMSPLKMPLDVSADNNNVGNFPKAITCPICRKEFFSQKRYR